MAASFVTMFLQHRETYGKARLLLADEVGVGRTLSLAASAMISVLLDDGPVLILCPSTLTMQWQVELADKLGIRMPQEQRTAGQEPLKKKLGVANGCRAGWYRLPGFLIIICALLVLQEVLAQIAPASIQIPLTEPMPLRGIGFFCEGLMRATCNPAPLIHIRTWGSAPKSKCAVWVNRV